MCEEPKRHTARRADHRSAREKRRWQWYRARIRQRFPGCCPSRRQPRSFWRSLASQQRADRRGRSCQRRPAPARKVRSGRRLLPVILLLLDCQASRPADQKIVVVGHEGVDVSGEGGVLVGRGVRALGQQLISSRPRIHGFVETDSIY